MDKRLTDLSKFLSFVLRHKPEAIGIALDREGWADIDALIAAAAGNGKRLDLDTIRAVVAGNDKQRFMLSDDGRRIRAVQGHSTDSVEIARAPKQPPKILYHGTATRFLESIRAQGLQPGQRHHVHLSEDIATAAAVGRRYGEPVILIVDAMRMHRHGHAFFQAENGVWLTACVPVGFLLGST